MIRNIPGFAPIATGGDKVPTAAPKAGAPVLPTVEKAKALAAARATQVLGYTRQSGTQEPLKHNLRMDGPTLELWTKAGYDPKDYPPVGYAELDSPALVAYKAKVAADNLAAITAAGQKPHSVNDKPEVPK
jgi:hypothetical protein